MKKFLLLALLALTSCSTLNADFQNIKTTVQKAVTPDNFDTVTALYGTTLASAVTYRNLCKSKAINKSCWLVIAKLQPYEQNAYAAYISLKRFVNNSPATADATTFIVNLKNAVLDFKNVQAQNGVI